MGEFVKVDMNLHFNKKGFVHHNDVYPCNTVAILSWSVD